MTTQSNLNDWYNAAMERDEQDSLKSFRDQFHIPMRDDGRPVVYLVGNSLGLQPKRTRAFVDAELEAWARLGVEGHFRGDFPWMPYHEFLTEPMARLVGADPSEVVVMNTLTVNLHLMMATFYRPTKQRDAILLEAHAFPSDHFAVMSQIEWHGLDPEQSMILVEPEPGQETLSTERICAAIDANADRLAMILLPGVQYYTGELLDIGAVTACAHAHEIPIGFDLAHAAGNVPLSLHDWGVDFACWCTYKYLNSGPGSVAGCFVHQRHASNVDLPRLKGWWGHDKSTRFEMQNRWQPIPTAEGWQLSNPPILSLASIRAALSVFEEAGGMAPLRAKSIQLTGFFQECLQGVLGDRVRWITPNEPERRGCQLSLTVALDGVAGRDVHEALQRGGMRTDWREPNVIRAAPVPLYNSFVDVVRFVDQLNQVLQQHS